MTTAPKRVGRALEKLRVILTRRGLTLSAGALAAALSGSATSSAPAGLAASIVTVSLAGASKLPAIGLAAQLVELVTAAKAKIAIASLAAASLLVPLALQYRANESLRAENASLRAQIVPSDELDRLRNQSQRLAGAQADADELARARSNQVELLRLRGEHAQLLGLRREVERLRASLNAAVSAATATNPASALDPDLETTNRVACMNHVRQLTLAAIFYKDEHQDTYPEAGAWCEALQKYFQDARFLRCPSHPDQSCSYAFNAKLSGLSETNVTAPSDTVVFFEAQSGWNGAGGLADVAVRHGDLVIVGFADGSCRALRHDRLQDLVWDPTAVTESRPPASRSLR